MAKSCAAQMEEGEIVALDSTRIDYNSNNIDLAAVGKRKDGTYGPQVSVSLLINVDNGGLICFEKSRLLSGITALKIQQVFEIP